MNISKKEKEELFEIYVIFYNEMCEEIDELTKPFRFEYEDRERFQEYSKTCEVCGHDYLTMYKSNHFKSPTHLQHAIEANKSLLDWRVFNYIENLKSKN
jgi:hypothetical protein